MRRYWVESAQIQPPHIYFENDVFHHIFSVCRQELGSKFEVLGDSHNAHLVEVIEVKKKSAIGRIIQTRQIPALAHPYIHLVISMPKFPTFESIIEKSVELGVKSIVPFFSDYSFIRKPENFPSHKKDRWQKIVVSATQQSGRADLLEIRTMQSFAQICQLLPPQTIFAYEGPGNENIHSFMSKTFSGPVSDVYILIGSEGGFSEKEVKELTSLNIFPLTLGEQVLRVETACISLISIVKFSLGLMR